MRTEGRIKPGRIARRTLFVALLTMLYLATYDIKAEELPVPTLEFEPAAPSFGALRRALEEDLTLEVKVHNRSEAAFDLREVKVGCGCMSVEVVSPGDIAPGEAGTLRVTLNHRRVKIGRVSYPLTVMKGSQISGSAQITYDYDPPIHAEHSELFIDADEPVEAVAATTVWVRNPDSKVAAPRVECDTPNFAVQLRQPTDARGGQYALSLRYVAAAGLPEETAHGTISVSLPGSDTPDLSIPFHCTIRPAIVVQPAALLLGTVSAGEEVRRVICLKSRKPFGVESVTTSSGRLTVEAKDPEAGEAKPNDAELTERSYEVVVSPAAGGGGAFEAEVRIVIAGAAGARLVIPVVAEVVAD